MERIFPCTNRNLKSSWLFPNLALATLDTTAQLTSFETGLLSWALGKVSQQYIIIPIIPVVNDSLTAEAYIRAIFLFMTFQGDDSPVRSVHYHMTKEEKKTNGVKCR